jgi:hypothetical protein
MGKMESDGVNRELTNAATEMDPAELKSCAAPHPDGERSVVLIFTRPW